MLDWRPWPKDVGRARVYEAGIPMTLHPGESAVAELPDLGAMVEMMAGGAEPQELRLRWHVYPTPTWAGLARRVWFRLTWWCPWLAGKPNLDVSMGVERKYTVH